MRRHLLVGLWMLVSAGAASAFEAGAAKVDMTPPLGAPMVGYLDRWGRGAVRVHDAISARCLYLDDGETQLFLVNTDLCVMNRELREKVLSYAPDVVPPDHIILTATHTHSGTGGTVHHPLLRPLAGPFRPDLLELTARKIAESMRLAYEARQRATIGYGTTTQKTLSRNRQVDDGPIDEQIGVIRVNNADGKAIAIVGNFAGHPTSVGGADFYDLSADYVGYYYTELERLADVGCIALFTNGAEGNQTIANPENKEGYARTESVGRLLALAVKTAANNIVCEPRTLRLQTATRPLPPSLMTGLVPEETTLQTLEIDGLLLTFFPGEPCVELGQEMRRRALARGYDTQFTVGLSNDHLLYFIPRKFYAEPFYEAMMNAYGPRIEDWFYREFEAMMSRGAAVTPILAAAELERTEIDGGTRLRVAGSAYAMGRARGETFKEELQGLFRERIEDAVERGDLLPETGLFASIPSFISPTVLAVPYLGITARTLLEGLPEPVFREIEGLADGAALAFDAAWLLQVHQTLAAQPDYSALYAGPFCTMFAVSGDRAGADDLLAGRNFDWSLEERPVIVEAQPDEGLAYVEVGFDWSVGGFSGMNAAGLVLCAERVESLEAPPMNAPPIELLLHGLLQSARTVDEVVAALAKFPQLRGYHVLAASPSPTDAAVIELGATQVTRRAEGGLLLGAVPAAEGLDPATAQRYSRVSALLQEERIVDRGEIATVLADTESSSPGSGAIQNERTRYRVIFEPRAETLHIALRQPSGAFGEPVSITLAPASAAPAPNGERQAR